MPASRPVQGEPLLPGPVLAAPYHLRGPADAAPYGYGRDAEPDLDAPRARDRRARRRRVRRLRVGHGGGHRGDRCRGCGRATCSSRRATATRASARWPRERLVPAGVEVRLVPTDTDAIVAASRGRRARVGRDAVQPQAATRATSPRWPTPRTPPARCWRSTTRSPRRSAAAARARRRLRDDLRDQARSPGTRTCCSARSASRDGALAGELRAGARTSGAILGPFEAWLAHRSLATLGLRLERSSANALAVAEALAGARRRHRRPPSGRRPGRGRADGAGPLSASRWRRAERAQAFLDALRLVTEATSFGGVALDRRAARRAGAPTTCRRASSASRPAARTRRTSSPTCCRRSTRAYERRRARLSRRALRTLESAVGRGSVGVRLAAPSGG